MSKYAIIQIGSFQYNVEEGKKYTVPYFTNDGKSFDVEKVLLIGEGKDLTVGKPVIEKAKVTLEIVENGQGEKVVSRIYKAKSRYRKTKGFRKQITTFVVKSIK